MTRHDWNKCLEGLRYLVKCKMRDLQRIPDTATMQRRTLGQEIKDINETINKIKTTYIWQNE